MCVTNLVWLIHFTELHFTFAYVYDDVLEPKTHHLKLCLLDKSGNCIATMHTDLLQSWTFAKYGKKCFSRTCRAKSAYFRSATIVVKNNETNDKFYRKVAFPTTMDKNNEKNDKFYRKVAFHMYTEMVNFRPQSWKTTSKQKPHRGLGTRLGCHPRDSGHVTH